MPPHLVTLKPCKIDPDLFGRPEHVPVFDADTPPKTAGLLLGGDTNDYKYSDAEWQAMLDFIAEQHARRGTYWMVSTSRRTPDWVGDKIVAARAASTAISKFIDYRIAGPGTLAEIFGAADVILCTLESSTMISEAIAARLPVIGLAPKVYAITDQEAHYRRYIEGENWTRQLSLAELSVARFEALLAEIRPMSANHIDTLAQNLRSRLPHLLE